MRQKWSFTLFGKFDSGLFCFVTMKLTERSLPAVTICSGTTGVNTGASAARVFRVGGWSRAPARTIDRLWTNGVRSCSSITVIRWIEAGGVELPSYPRVSLTIVARNFRVRFANGFVDVKNYSIGRRAGNSSAETRPITAGVHSFFNREFSSKKTMTTLHCLFLSISHNPKIPSLSDHLALTSVPQYGWKSQRCEEFRGPSNFLATTSRVQLFFPTKSPVEKKSVHKPFLFLFYD